MHISLDSAIGQQRRLNQVGETINSIAAPAAAYSLRSLTGGDPKVVRVRREGDNGEQDFTVSEINSGALVDYINTNGVFQNTGYESFSNASASGFTASNTGSTGFAVSDLPDGTSGTAISVSFDISITNGSPSLSLRNNLTGSGTASNSVNYTSSGSKTATLTANQSYVGIGFTEGDAPSNFTVSNFKILGDGFVETWYDQSGNGRDVVQTTAANQPKIVNSGVLLADGIEFDGSNDSLSTASGVTLASSDDLSVFLVTNPDAASGQHPVVSQEDGTGTGRSFIETTSTINTFLGGSEQNFGSASASQNIITLLYDDSASTLDAFKNGSQSGSQKTSITVEAASGALNIGINKAGSQFFDGHIDEIIVYLSDQTANRTTLETNINSHYSIF